MNADYQQALDHLLEHGRACLITHSVQDVVFFGAIDPITVARFMTGNDGREHCLVLYHGKTGKVTSIAIAAVSLSAISDGWDDFRLEDKFF